MTDMGEKTEISWCNHTFNPWIGCSKVSAGCQNCYAERQNNFYHWVDNGWGVNGHRKRTNTEYWKKPLAWNEAARLANVRRKVFCGSLCDVFEDRPELDAWRTDLFDLIGDTENLDWLLLTKRPENILQWYGNDIAEDEIRPNMWLGVTCENQEMVNERIPLLINIPAHVHFVSVEPMLEKIDLHHIQGNYVVYDVIGKGRFDYGNDGFGVAAPMSSGISWVICGGESGPGCRPMDLDWARDLRNQCRNADVPFFFKQVGGTKRIGGIGGHWGGDLLDGREYKEFPQ